MATTRPFAYIGLRDWYLPSQDEIDYVNSNLHNEGVGGLSDGTWYWTSTENDSTTAIARRIGYETTGAYGKNSAYSVRPIRSFTGDTYSYSLRDAGPGGGLIFFITGNTYYQAYPTDIPNEPWSNINDSLIGTTGVGVGTGKQNTLDIINQAGHTASAAKDCNNTSMVASLTGVTNYGEIAIGESSETYRYDLNYGGIPWYMGPDEEAGDVLVVPPVSGYVPGMYRTKGFTASGYTKTDDFINIVNTAARQRGKRPYTTVTSANNYLSQISGYTSFTGVTYEPEASALFTRVTGMTLSSGQKELINQTIRDLKELGVWEGLDCFQTYGLGGNFLLNWIGDYSNAIMVNSPTYVEGLGYAVSNGQYVQTNFIGEENGVNITTGSTSYGCSCETDEIYGNYHIYGNESNYRAQLHRTDGNDLWTNQGSTVFYLNSVNQTIIGNHNCTRINAQYWGHNDGVLGSRGRKSDVSDVANLGTVANNLRLQGFLGDGVIFSTFWIGSAISDDKQAEFSNILDRWRQGTRKAAYCAEAEEYFTRMTGATADAKALINQLFIDLKEEGFWDRIREMHILCTHDAESSLVPVKDSNHTLTAVNSPTFEAYKGWVSDGVSATLNANYHLCSGNTYGYVSLSDDNPLISTDFSIGMFSKEYVDQNGYVFGIGANDQSAYILSRYRNTSGTLYGAFVNASVFAYYTGGTEYWSTDGVLVVQRDTSDTAKIIWNGDVSEQSSQNKPDSRAGSGGFSPSRPFQICGAYGVEALSWVGGIWIMDAMTDAEHQTMYEIMNQFKDDMYQLGQ